MRRSVAYCACLLLLALLACKKLRQREQEPSASSAQPSASYDKAPEPTPVPAAPKPSVSPEQARRQALSVLFSGAPAKVGTVKVPIRVASAPSGAVAQAPADWKGDEWNPDGVAGPAYAGDVYGDSLIFSAPDGHAYLNYRVDKVKVGSAPKQYGAVMLKSHAYAAYITKVTWEEPIEGQVGPQFARALVWAGEGVGVMKGRGKPWKAYAVSLVIGKKNVLVVGSYDAAYPQYEAAVIDGIKAISG